MKRAIVMMAKPPIPGQVKTRLAATIGDDAAADLHAAFIADVAATIASVPDAKPFLAWTGDRDHPGFAPAVRHRFEFVPQGDGGLGERLDHVGMRLAGECSEVLIVGSDSPTLASGHFEEAFLALRHAPVVLGPSFDGGYYLVGFRSRWFAETAREEDVHPLFRDVPWSTPAVLAATLANCAAVDADVELLGFWYDVDEIADLDLLRTHLLDYLRSTEKGAAPNTVEVLVQRTAHGSHEK